MLTTPTIFKQIAPRADGSAWIPALATAMSRYGIDQKTNREIDFLSHAIHESAGFSVLVENLNYSAEGLARVWPSRYGVKVAGSKGNVVVPNTKARRLARNPEAIANDCYGGRMGNGPPESGEGWLFRGRGAFMNTGKNSYQTCGAALGIDLVGHPELLEQPQWAALAAGWHWQKTNCNAMSDSGDPDFKLTTKAINGGLIGLEERIALRAKIRKLLTSKG